MALTLITFMSFGHLKLFHVNLRDHQMICNFEICRYLFKDNCIKLPYTMYKKGHHHKLHIFQSYSTLCLWWTQMLSGIEPVALMGKNWSSPKASTALQQQGGVKERESCFTCMGKSWLFPFQDIKIGSETDMRARWTLFDTLFFTTTENRKCFIDLLWWKKTVTTKSIGNSFFPSIHF